MPLTPDDDGNLAPLFERARRNALSTDQTLEDTLKELNEIAA
jgi:hypothetical protein